MTKQLKTVKLKDIVPYENNPRHNDQAVDAVKESIRQCEYIAPIIVDEDMVILAGHTRHKALKALGKKEAEVMIVTGLTDEQKRKYRLLDNKTNELAEWDVDLLEVELDDLDFDGYDFGFDIEQIEPEPEVEEDNYTETDVETRCKLGDLWQLGDHRLICGDSTDPEVVERLMGGVQADLLLTDPPYGIEVVAVNNKVGGDKPFGSKGKVGFGTVGKNKICECNEYSPIIGDDTTDTARDCYSLSVAYTKNQIIFGGNYFTDFLPPSRCWIVWDKQNTGNFADAELGWTSFDKGVKMYRFMWNGLIREGDRSVEGKTRVHPTQKPVGLMGYILKDFTKEDDNILDLFGGSGSTLIACEQLNRRCFMCELDEHYCDVIIDRWEQFTGKKAVLLNE